MNNKVKSLLAQAHLEFHPDTNAVAERFAELIIDACLYACENIRQDALVQKKSEFLTESGKTLYEGVYGGATNCGFAIQSMFKSE